METAVDQLVAAGAPVWLTIIVIITPMLLTFSKAAGRLPGVLGAASRWWQTRQLREVERAEDLDKAIDAAVKRRVEEELAPIRDRMRRMEERLKVQEDEIALRDEYILLQARHARNVAEWAIENGHELPPPPAPPRFTQWVIDRKRRPGDPPQRE
ncbi:hypothetical protein [Corynebacterium liangguodongii]|uniref:Uncharacterized protein n=1 Tax=Corynebacterium liangguodongii TaxID=2079535 RepID=A0A2S0WG58_9CORY|nr:hypothetical protein [Corynebacterium liangguodongii]AWB84768.1 hypothetical protein C3E79_10030 [Corynebacterium liangguodongii]PWB99126.1 hypothetical protein DF219_07645 [Corynebacterium liangguodongii]